MAAEALLSTIKKQAAIPTPSLSSVQSTSSALPSLNTSSAPSTAEHPIGPNALPKPAQPVAQPVQQPTVPAPQTPTTPQPANGVLNNATAGTQPAQAVKPKTPPVSANPTSPLQTTPTNPEEPVANTAALPSATKSVFDQAIQDSSAINAQEDALKNADIASQGQLTDAVTQAATDKYATEQANNDKLQATQEQILKDRNAAIAGDSQQAKLEAQNAYDANQANIAVQAMRTQQADHDRILDQMKANKLRELNSESRIAAMGGYGTQQAYTQMTNESLDNDRVINSLTLQADANNIEYSNKFKQNSNDYQAALSSINNKKQADTAASYDKYLEYVTKIANDRELGATEKAAAIKEAKASYADKVSKINHDSFNDKYTKTWDVANKAQDLLKQRRDDARGIMSTMLNNYALSDKDLTPEQQKQLANLEQQAGLPIGSSATGIGALKEQARRGNLDMQAYTDDQGNVTYATVNKLTGKMENSFTVQGVSKTAIGKFTTQFNPDTLETTTWDTSTGKPGSTQGPFTNFTQAGGDPSQGVPGMNRVGNQVIDPKAYNKIFQIGSKGGQCGTWASTISTAPRVGNMYKDKIDKVDTMIPKVGNKLILPLKAPGTGKFNAATDPGHVAVVTSYDPVTKIIGIAQSNIKLDGIVTTGTYNLDTLKANYGTNWGFITGDLKPEIQSQLLKTPTFTDTQSVVNQGTATKGEISMEDVTKAYADAGQQDKIATYGDQIKALLAARSSKGSSLPKSLTTLPTPEEYKANPEKYADLSPTQREALVSKIGLEKASNPSSSFNYDPDKARTELESKPAISVYNAIKPLTDSVNQLNKQAASGIGDPGSFDLTIQTVLGEITKQGATKAAGGGIPESKFKQAEVWLNSLDSNETLSDEARKSALDVVNTFYKSYTNQVKDLVKTYGDQAVAKSADPNDVIRDYADLYSPAKAQNNSSAPQAKDQITKAANAGYSPAEIVDHLSKNPTYSQSIQKAIAAGYSPEEIVIYYSK